MVRNELSTKLRHFLSFYEDCLEKYSMEKMEEKKRKKCLFNCDCWMKQNLILE